jgi:hypothetical protein
MQREVDLRDRFLVQQGFLYSAVIHGCNVEPYEKNRRKEKGKKLLKCSKICKDRDSQTTGRPQINHA